jgi:RES domain-containing protein
MLVYRIAKKEFIEDLSGTGAALYGGRWNPKGINMVYTAGNIALAYVEFLVHNYHLIKETSICMVTIALPQKLSILEVFPEELPVKWYDLRSKLAVTQEIGKRFIQQTGAYVLKVPSAVVPGEFNYLLNPMHQEHRYTKIMKIVDPLKYDSRLLSSFVFLLLIIV